MLYPLITPTAPTSTTDQRWSTAVRRKVEHHVGGPHPTEGPPCLQKWSAAVTTTNIWRLAWWWWWWWWAVIDGWSLIVGSLKVSGTGMWVRACSTPEADEPLKCECGGKSWKVWGKLEGPQMTSYDIFRRKNPSLTGQRFQFWLFCPSWPKWRRVQMQIFRSSGGVTDSWESGFAGWLKHFGEINTGEVVSPNQLLELLNIFEPTKKLIVG